MKKRGKRGPIRSVEVTFRFDTSYALKTILDQISGNINGEIDCRRRKLVEGGIVTATATRHKKTD